MSSSEKSPPVLTFAPRTYIEQPVCDPQSIGQRLKLRLAELGLLAVGFAPVEEFDEARIALNSWIASGHNGTMQYLANGVDRCSPRSLLPQASTLIVVAAPYQEPGRDVLRLPMHGQIAGYARGGDYHTALRHSLHALGQMVADYSGRAITARACVDTAPLLEREAARRAGLGFIGKSNMLIIPGIGSRVMLGVLLVDVEVGEGTTRDTRCGRCSICLTACPTQAFVGPWQMDARRCISYLTIEFKGWILHELRPLMGTHLFGCDVCQDVCPFNHGNDALGATPKHDSSLAIKGARELLPWLGLTSSDYRRITKGTALRRASRAQLLRNAAIAAGNLGSPELVEPLKRLLTQSTYPIVRGHAAWALGQLGTKDAIETLTTAPTVDEDELVRFEIKLALSIHSLARVNVE